MKNYHNTPIHDIYLTNWKLLIFELFHLLHVQNIHFLHIFQHVHNTVIHRFYMDHLHRHQNILSHRWEYYLWMYFLYMYCHFYMHNTDRVFSPPKF